MVKVNGCSRRPRQFLVAVLGMSLLAAFGAGQALQAQHKNSMAPAQNQPTPPRVPQRQGRVVRAQLGVVPPRSIARCPVQENFSGTITTNGPAEVTYTWLSSDGATWPQGTLRFSGAGTQKVHQQWTLGAPGQMVRQWVELKVISPNTMLSPRAGFGFRCPGR